MKPHYHYTVIGGQKGEQTGEYHQCVEVHIEATSETDAIEKAKAIIERPNYFVRAIKECFGQDNRELQEEMLKHLRHQNEDDHNKQPWELD